MIRTDQIKALNVEVSSRCTARCPFCSRRQKVRSYGGHLMTLEDFQQLPKALFAGLKRITFAGNFGDLSSNPQFKDIAAYVKACNGRIILGGDTNGMVQPPEWWRELGASFRDGGLIFALDGLEDTHALHRVGTDFNTILDNMSAFIDGGGAAYWKFLVFKHNEHQIQTAESMAKKMGCRGFFAMSSRDYSDALQRPSEFEFEMKRDIFSARLDASPCAMCNPLRKGSIYLAADGTVHPCCFAHCMYVTEHNRQFDFIVPLIEKYLPQINFKTRPLEEILAGPYFNEVIAQSRDNVYCRMKCNPNKHKIRRELVLHETLFEGSDTENPAPAASHTAKKANTERSAS